MATLPVEIAVYIHIPFCQRKCPYCDFNSYAGCADLYDAYVEAVCREMAAVAGRGEDRAVSYVARTLFFGGGTPSVLAPRHFERMLHTAQELFDWHGGLETSTEANPGTIDVELIRALRSLGVNRISLGIQSFDDAMLHRLGRIHDSRQALDAIESCRRAGIENLNLDLMFGLPGQDVAHWRQTIDQALSACAEHLSLYPLAVEEGTPFWDLQEAGRLATPPEDDVAEMYELAEDMLGGCYEHYEISNWASIVSANAHPLASHRCRHNLAYWRNEPYLGLGAGAHSSIGAERFANVKLPIEYIDRIGSLGDAVDYREPIGHGLEMAETLILGLRLSDGVDRTEFSSRFHLGLDEALGELLPRLSEQQLICDDGRKITLTPRGRLLANEVFAPILDRFRRNTPEYRPG